MAREIIVAAKDGGGNPDANLRLKLAIQKARSLSMPADNIKRAIQRGTGESGESVNFEEIIYEGYGAAGVAVLVSCLTDNRNRTVAELRYIFTKNGGNLGESGCVGWMFDARGLVQIMADKSDEETVMMATMDAGAQDIKVDEETIEVYCDPGDLNKVREALNEAGIEFISAEMTRIPQTTVRVEDSKEAARVFKLMDSLEDLDDVQQAYANFDIPDEIIQELAG
jgi:YebC/PmpR family DNA-binding regulatory protein